MKDRHDHLPHGQERTGTIDFKRLGLQVTTVACTSRAWEAIRTSASRAAASAAGLPWLLVVAQSVAARLHAAVEPRCGELASLNQPRQLAADFVVGDLRQKDRGSGSELL